MASAFSRKFLLQRLMIRRPALSLLYTSSLLEASNVPNFASNPSGFLHPSDRPQIHGLLFSSKFSTSSEAPGPTSVDCRSILPEDEFQKLADETLHDLQEKFEEYGDDIQIDGFDIDYGNHVLTVKLGDLGTYVINKQTPNRQIWLSSPVSGPSRFDWDGKSDAWIYRRTKANLVQLLEEEVVQLCGKPISLS